MKPVAMNYDGQWQDLKKRRRLFWFVFFCWAPVSALIGISLDAMSPGLGSRSFLWIVGPWLVAILAADVYLMIFPCPRCGERYFYGSAWNLFRRNCANCGLPLWQSIDLTQSELR
jgi:hypothetical protein